MKTAYPCGAADTEEQRFSPADILQNATMLTRRRIVDFLVYKKYSRRFKSVRLNH